MKNDSPITSPNIPMAKVRQQELQVYVKSNELPTSMTAIRLWRQLYVRKYIDEGKSLHTILSVFAKSLRDEIKTYYQSCLDDDDYPLTRHTEPISDKHGSQVLLNRARAHLG